MPRTLQRIHGALIYARFSTEHQSDKSIDEQVADCKAWCQAQGILVLGIFADYAISGTKASRPQFDAALDVLRAGEADTLVCYDQSRLSRDFLNWFALRQELQSLGVRIASITQDYVGGDIRDSSVLIQETIIALHNQMHIADTKRKVKAALRYRAQTGQHTGGKPPLGYDLVDKRLVINRSEAATVRRIFSEYAQGRSYREIIAGLNRDGITTKRGSAFGSNSLHDLLKNKKYIGIVEYGCLPYGPDGRRNSHGDKSADALTLERPELAIIEKSLFERVQAKMAENKKGTAGRPATARSYPLKGKVFCADCGSAMTVFRSKKNEHIYYYYKCSRKDRTFDCKGRPIRCDELEDIVLTYVRSVLGSPDTQRKVAELVRAETDKIIGGSTARFEAAQKRLSDTEKQINNIIDAIAKGAFSDALNARLKSLEGDKAQLQAELARIRRAAEIAAIPEENFRRLVQSITTTAADDAVLSIVPRVEVGQDTIKIFTAFDPDQPPKEPPDKTHTAILRPESTNINGTPSGVPLIMIDAIGISIIAKRPPR